MRGTCRPPASGRCGAVGRRLRRPPALPGRDAAACAEAEVQAQGQQAEQEAEGHAARGPAEAGGDEAGDHEEEAVLAVLTGALCAWAAGADIVTSDIRDHRGVEAAFVVGVQAPAAFLGRLEASA